MLTCIENKEAAGAVNAQRLAQGGGCAPTRQRPGEVTTGRSTVDEFVECGLHLPVRQPGDADFQGVLASAYPVPDDVRSGVPEGDHVAALLAPRQRRAAEEGADLPRRGQADHLERLSNGPFTTVEGCKLTTSGSGSNFKVNGKANIVCGNNKAANATIYVIDSVLQPPS
ncbi:fasciclin domain-containing protein [Streptomyces sp. NPDC001102]